MLKKRFPSHWLLECIGWVIPAVALRWPWLHRAVWNLDEGSTFTMAQQILAGDVLYADAADNRSPLVPYLKAAIFALTGAWNTFAVHLVLAVLMGVVAWMLFALARRLGDPRAGVGAAVIFTVLSFVMLDSPDAISANTGWCLVIFSAGGFFAFVRALNTGRRSLSVLAGTLFGCSLLCKQPGLLDFAVTWVLLILIGWRTAGSRRNLWALWLAGLLGAVLPIIATIVYFAVHGALRDFWFYSYTYNVDLYVPEVSRLARWAQMQRPFVLAFTHSPASAVLLVGGAFALGWTCWHNWRARGASLRPLPWLIIGWSAAGVLATGLSGRDFSHYSAQAVPGFSLAAGWLLARFWEWRPIRFPRVAKPGQIAILAVIAGLLVVDLARREKVLDAKDESQQPLGRTIALYTAPEERIFVWGYFPELYLFSQRLPASRFLYTNYVTGLIPWTNLDPWINTDYAIVPGAHEQLAADLRRHPPAMVVDTGGGRGYLKYPLAAQPFWRQLRAQFALVHAGNRGLAETRLYRRLRPPSGDTWPVIVAKDSQIQLEGERAVGADDAPGLRVRGPAGVTRVDLFGGTIVVASLDHPPTVPVSVVFDASEPDWQNVPLQVRLVHADGSVTYSGPFDFRAFAEAEKHRQIDGPAVRLGNTLLRPLRIEGYNGVVRPGGTEPGTWRLDAPAVIEYRDQPAATSWTFVHGLEPSCLFRSDGYDLVVEYVRDDGKRLPLAQQRLHPFREGRDQLKQEMKVQLPPRGPGRIVFRFTAGESNNPEWDSIYFGQLAASANGPVIALGEQPITPQLSTVRGGEPMNEEAPGRWSANSPARIEWDLAGNLGAADFTFGMADGAFTDPKGHSDGVVIAVDLIAPTGTTRIFNRNLDPYSRIGDRGAQTAHVEIPPPGVGRLVLSVDPGVHQDDSWDWVWLGKVNGEGVGPDLVIGPDRRLVPVSSHVMGREGPPSHHDLPERWNAHAEAELVYSRPADLARVTFTYGLAPGADRDDAGTRRSDGVDVIVEFAPETGAPVELFRRNLDPFAREADRGMQTTRMELPRTGKGRLIFRITPGPSGSNSYDWAGWGKFTGELYR